MDESESENRDQNVEMASAPRPKTRHGQCYLLAIAQAFSP